MVAIREHPELELQLVVGASALLDRYGGTIKPTSPRAQPRGYATAPSVFWQAPRSQSQQPTRPQRPQPRSGASSRARRQAQGSVPASPPAGPCAIGTRNLGGAQPLFGTVVTRTRPFPQVIGPAYLSSGQSGNGTTLLVGKSAARPDTANVSAGGGGRRGHGGAGVAGAGHERCLRRAGRCRS